MDLNVAAPRVTRPEDQLRKTGACSSAARRRFKACSGSSSALAMLERCAMICAMPTEAETSGDCFSRCYRYAARVDGRMLRHSHRQCPAVIRSRHTHILIRASSAACLSVGVAFAIGCCAATATNRRNEAPSRRVSNPHPTFEARCFRSARVESSGSSMMYRLRYPLAARRWRR